ncbi:hypothetical protein N8H72_18500 [Pseudomonas koreensis]|uniref:hypothetical protein n=1 Tax=Pseudomonas koreensis TaxID=198620 RepID=UPI0021C68500|nr:hypothetical protein [Pseudomonas koreensis]MCU0091971.1 hypothetical protein [Pseudomonas koreensis]
MPIKPPVKGSGPVDIHLKPSSDGSVSGPVIRPSVHGNLPEPPAIFSGARTPHHSGAEVVSPPSSITFRDALPVVEVAPTVGQLPLEAYHVPAASRLTDIDADGFRTFKGRQFAELPGQGIVQVGADPQTGLYRARLASELNPSGPVLERDSDGKLWHPLEEFATDRFRTADPRSEAASTLEAMPHPEGDEGRARADDADDEFELASESMPVKPYTDQELASMRDEVRYSFRGNRLGTYDRANNGKYPLRDTLGRPVRIRKLETLVTLTTGERFRSEPIKPYIKFEGYEDVARLYEEKLELRTFTEADMKVPGEKALIGQLMVVANKRISKGEALGLYGGTLSPVRLVRREEQTFTMLAGFSVHYTPGKFVEDPVVVIGDNIISRINSNFEYDATGKPIHQSPDGYNVQIVGFKVEADMLIGDRLVNRPYMLNALFASEDIAAGTELRWNYNYSDKEMKMIFP